MTDFGMPEPRPYNAEFWEAAADGRLVIQRCDGCDVSVYPPRSACPECLGDLVWEESEGTGSLYSYTHLHHPDPPGAVPETATPVVGCIAELDEGVRIASRLVVDDPDSLAIGMDLTVTFGETPDGRAVPLFEPA
jgi:hypothetical protein